jgi:hypothetical protein
MAAMARTDMGHSGPLRLLAAIALALSLQISAPGGAFAQAPSSNSWQTDTTDSQKSGPAPVNTTVVPRATAPGKAGGGQGQVTVAAYLTADSRAITQGLIWRVFREKAGPGGKAALLSTSREASPTLRLDAGTYYINVAYGRAYVTRKIAIAGDQTLAERFVLDAGGLRVVPALAGGEPANDKLVSYDVESDERDEHGQRTKVVAGVKAGTVLRLNAGAYSVVSTYGDANAVARADVAVEAGKLSEATLTHAAAKVSFKLVTRGGGEAIADTQWSVVSGQGDAVKESSGALPTHFLAPGSYAVRAKHAGRVYKRDFSVKAGDNALIEVIMP